MDVNQVYIMCSCRSTLSLHFYNPWWQGLVHKHIHRYTHHRHNKCNVNQVQMYSPVLELLYCVVFRSSLVSQAHSSCRPPSEIVRAPRVRLLLHLDDLQLNGEIGNNVTCCLYCCHHRHLYSITLAGVKLAGVLQLLGNSLWNTGVDKWNRRYQSWDISGISRQTWSFHLINKLNNAPPPYL